MFTPLIKIPKIDLGNQTKPEKQKTQISALENRVKIHKINESNKK